MDLYNFNLCNIFSAANKYAKIFLFLTVITLSGCDNINKLLYKDAFEENKINAKDSVSDIRKQNEITEVDSVIRTYEGLVIINLDEKSFRDCSYPDSLYFIKDETGSLLNFYEKLNPMKDVYKSVYSSVKGFTLNTDSLTKADPEKYSKVLVVKEVIAVEGKNFRNTCIPFEYWCLGNEPNWTLQISKKENIFEFYLPSENKSYYFNYNELKEEDGEIKYFGYNNIHKTTINISIKKEICSDTMSDKIYEYSVKVNLNGDKKFSGCAIKGNFIE